jgi:hypothetical protein
MYLCPLPSNRDAHQNVLSAPEVWHTRATILNAIASSNYIPAVSLDPSSLSQSGGVSTLRDPQTHPSVIFIPPNEISNLKLIWRAHVLDC